MKTSQSFGIPLRSWIYHPWWDLCFFSFSWLPLFVLLIIAIDNPYRASHGTVLWYAAVLVSAVLFTHRYYTIYVAYGDRETFRNHFHRLLITPFLILGLVIAIKTDVLSQSFVYGFAILLILWEIWHTMMQRYGIFRTYAVRLRRNLESKEHAKLDFLLIMSALLFTFFTTYFVHGDNIIDESYTKLVYSLKPAFAFFPFLLASLVVLTSLSAVAIFICWLKAELKAGLPVREYLPRWIFLIATLSLLFIFVIYGPIVGVLCSKFSHSIEYLAYVHAYEFRKTKKDRSSGPIMSVFMKGAFINVPLLLAVHFAFYFLIFKTYHSTWLSLAILYMTVSILHFIYDGWIWKVSKPHVAHPFAEAVPG